MATLHGQRRFIGCGGEDAILFKNGHDGKQSLLEDTPQRATNSLQCDK